MNPFKILLTAQNFTGTDQLPTMDDTYKLLGK